MFKRGNTWYIRVKGVRVSAGTEVYADAKALEDRLNHQQWLDEKMGIKPPKSWQEAVVRWCQERAHKKSLKDDIFRFRWLDKHLGHITDISKINRDLLHSAMLTRGINLVEPISANTTANHYVVLVGCILKAAETQWGWGNTCPRFRTYKTPPSPGIDLSVEEWERLEEELPEHLRRIAKFALCTGLRHGKIFSLTWGQVDLEKRTLHHDGAGNKIANTIPLNDGALAVLKEIKQGPVVHKDRVFTRNGVPLKTYSSTGWKLYCAKAQIRTIRFHDLRHTFVSWLAQNGVDREIRMRLVGHKLPSSHDRYTHMSTEDLLPYSKVIDSILAQSTGKKEAIA